MWSIMYLVLFAHFTEMVISSSRSSTSPSLSGSTSTTPVGADAKLAKICSDIGKVSSKMTKLPGLKGLKDAQATCKGVGTSASNSTTEAHSSTDHGSAGHGSASGHHNDLDTASADTTSSDSTSSLPDSSSSSADTTSSDSADDLANDSDSPSDESGLEDEPSSSDTVRRRSFRGRM